VNLTVSFALRGAGDTRFVTAVALAVAWPVMVLPTYLAWHFGWGLYAAWAFASAYIIVLSFTFLCRFLQGKWRTMRVIETPAPAPVEVPTERPEVREAKPLADHERCTPAAS